MTLAVAEGSKCCFFYILDMLAYKYLKMYFQEGAKMTDCLSIYRRTVL